MLYLKRFVFVLLAAAAILYACVMEQWGAGIILWFVCMLKFLLRKIPCKPPQIKVQ